MPHNNKLLKCASDTSKCTVELIWQTAKWEMFGHHFRRNYRDWSKNNGLLSLFHGRRRKFFHGGKQSFDFENTCFAIFQHMPPNTALSSIAKKLCVGVISSEEEKALDLTWLIFHEKYWQNVYNSIDQNREIRQSQLLSLGCSFCTNFRHWAWNIL